MSANLTTNINSNYGNSDANATDYAISNRLMNINTVAICRVVAIGSAPKSYNVQQIINYTANDGKPITPPVIYNVPIMDVVGSGCGIEIVYTIGDLLLVAFSQRDLTNYKIAWANGSNPTLNLNANSNRVMSITDAIILGHLSPTPPTIKVKITPAGIDIIGNTQPINITTNGNVTTTCTTATTNCTTANISANGSIAITSPITTITGNLIVTGDTQLTTLESTITSVTALTIGGNPYLAHVHNGVTSGTSNTGGVV